MTKCLIAETTETFLYLTTQFFPDTEFEISDELYARFCRVRDEWQRVQHLLDAELAKMGKSW